MNTHSLLPFIGAAAVAIACGAGTPVAPTQAAAAPPAVRRVVVLGDSLAVSPSRAQAFPAQLQVMVERAGLPWAVLNAGISGDTTAGGVQRVEALLAPDVGVLVLALGANDGLRGLPPDNVRRNLSTIIDAAQARSIDVLLCGMETLPTHGWDYMLAFHRLFPAVASEHRVPLVPFLLEGVALVTEMNGPDGVHPNSAGARRIAETVWPALERLLRDQPLVSPATQLPNSTSVPLTD
jgi:acyl-CoA thioesterase I